MGSTRTIPNRTFRRWLLELNGLSAVRDDDPLPHPGPRRGVQAVHAMARRLGFVQIDPICVVARAHDQILFSRLPGYRPGQLREALEDRRTLFENWTHDAAVIPVEHFPYWRHAMDRFRRGEVHPGYQRYFSVVSDDALKQVRDHIRRHGPTKPRDLGTPQVRQTPKGWPTRSVAKVAIEYLWRIGEMAVTHRDGQEKVYDLASRVIPEPIFRQRVRRTAYVDWVCREALRRLGAATPAQIARCFEAVATKDAQAWCERNLGGPLESVVVELADRTRSRPLFALREDLDRMDTVPAASRRLRLLSPFDPLIHDRKRTASVFGFDYRVEIFVPAAKRRHGYYVLPILEGERFVGRTDLKLDRKAACLDVINLWWEPGIQVGANRRRQLERALERQANFAGAKHVRYC